ncbi:MAG: hypothetical protein LBQ24_07940 [Candidatus Peribacteria bacterium]|nr:hypothetical protein [Candidatus Peribacteria bacterium]
MSILFDKLLYIDTSSFDDTTAYFIEYFYYKVYILLSEIEELKLNEVLTLNINDVDKKLAEEKVLALQ